jgi:hypothetical protein
MGSGALVSQFDAAVSRALTASASRPAELLTEGAIAGVPAVVQRYIRRAGVIGKPRPTNMRIAFDALMYQKPGAKPLVARSVQYNFFDHPTRLFFMKARMFALPVRVLHAYVNEQATMQVRVAGLFNMVQLAGVTLSVAETVTLLNDLCLFAPGALVDPRISWEEIDGSSVGVRFRNGPRSIGATLRFGPAGELLDFFSDDRPGLQADGTLRAARWSTPVPGYGEVKGYCLPTGGSAIYHYPEGDFTYGVFTLRSIDYNLAQPIDR